MAEWLYFGCHRQAGHYLFDQNMQQIYSNRTREKLERFDGMLAPQDKPDGYVAVVTRLGGWGLSVLAFWDYSVDKRGGSNSMFFAPLLTITPENLLKEAQERFPKVFERLPQPVVLRPQE